MRAVFFMRYTFHFSSIIILFSLFSLYSQTYKDDSLAVRALLDSNVLHDIAVEEVTIVENERIVELLLYMEEISYIPPVIGNLTKLKILYLFYNNLSSLPAEIGNLKELTELHLNDNYLTSLPPEIGNLTNLRILDVSANALDSIPSEIGNCTMLDTLNAKFNSISFVPEQLCALNNCKTLLLGNNSIKELPQQIGNLGSLQSLSLELNQLLSLPQSITKLKPEIFLDLGYNSLAELPEAIAEWATTYDPDWKTTQDHINPIHTQNNSFLFKSPAISITNSYAVFYTPHNASVRFAVYNACGKMVASLFNGYAAAGNHRFSLPLQQNASGMYYYTLIIDNTMTSVKKMVVKK